MPKEQMTASDVFRHPIVISLVLGVMAWGINIIMDWNTHDSEVIPQVTKLTEFVEEQKVSNQAQAEYYNQLNQTMQLSALTSKRGEIRSIQKDIERLEETPMARRTEEENLQLASYKAQQEAAWLELGKVLDKPDGTRAMPAE